MEKQSDVVKSTNSNNKKRLRSSQAEDNAEVSLKRSRLLILDNDGVQNGAIDLDERAKGQGEEAVEDVEMIDVDTLISSPDSNLKKSGEKSLNSISKDAENKSEEARMNTGNGQNQETKNVNTESLQHFWEDMLQREEGKTREEEETKKILDPSGEHLSVTEAHGLSSKQSQGKQDRQPFTAYNKVDHNQISKDTSDVMNQHDWVIVSSHAPVQITDEAEEKVEHFAHKSRFWIVLFLLAQLGLLFGCPQYFTALFSAFTVFSENLILTCKATLGVESRIIEKITRVEVKVEIDQEPHIIIRNMTDSSHITNHIESLIASKSAFRTKKKLTEEKCEKMMQQTHALKPKLSARRKSLETWEAALQTAEQEIRALIATSPQNVIIFFAYYNIAEALQRVYESSNKRFESKIVVANIPMWEISSESNCNSLIGNNDPIVSSDDITRSVDEFQQQFLRLIADFKEDKEVQDAISFWIENKLKDRNIQKYTTKIATEDNQGEKNEILDSGLTKEGVQKIVNKLIKTDFANKIGLFDTASLFNGAQLIYNGLRATSPSLTESLPFLNRLLAYTNMEHYGYGAEVALTPTVPKDAVGQCWPFRNVSKSKDPLWNHAFSRDNANGRFASLSVRLANAVTAKRVVIEHVVSPGKPSSAIRDFRIIGYEDENAFGSPFNLGTFVYRLDGDLVQEFFLSEKNEVIKSITLAIDSAYQEDFACLYRFSVMEA